MGPGGGSFDALNRILADLSTRGNPKVLFWNYSFSGYYVHGMFKDVIFFGLGAKLLYWV